jgi:hypothetical protein
MVSNLQLLTGGAIKSSNFSAGSTGFNLPYSGSAEFNDVTVRGHVEASSGSFSGTVNASSGSFTGTVNASSGSFTGTVYATEGRFSAGIGSISSQSFVTGTNQVSIPDGGGIVIISPYTWVGSSPNEQKYYKKSYLIFYSHPETYLAITQLNASFFSTLTYPGAYITFASTSMVDDIGATPSGIDVSILKLTN